MKSILRAAAASTALATFAFASTASAATSDSANVTAEILNALSVTVDGTANTLNFGQISDGGIAGAETVTVDPSTGNVSVCTGLLLCTGTSAAPNFDVVGTPSENVQVTFLNASETLTLVGPLPVGMVGTMDVDTFTTDVAGDIVALSPTGTGTFNVGGTLTVVPLQAPGTYNGTLTVEVAYN